MVNKPKNPIKCWGYRPGYVINPPIATIGILHSRHVPNYIVLNFGGEEPANYVWLLVKFYPSNYRYILYICIYIYVYMYIYMYIYIYVMSMK